MEINVVIGRYLNDLERGKRMNLIHMAIIFIVCIVVVEAVYIRYLYLKKRKNEAKELMIKLSIYLITALILFKYITDEPLINFIPAFSYIPLIIKAYIQKLKKK